MKAEAVFVDGLRFVASADSNRSIVVDGAPTGGGADTAIHPTELLLVGLITCTGMDVVSILRKMRVAFRDFRVTAEAEREPEYPKAFTAIRLTYSIRGRDVPEDKVTKAIELSQDRYCTASASLRKAVPIIHTLAIQNEEEGEET
jgi:putative redox protein